jgi:fructokinase
MRPTILALGELLWDIFPDGPRFGGAPVNFACACAGLGGSSVRSMLASAVGPDDLGREAFRRLHERNVDSTHVAVHDRPTGQVLVDLDVHGKATYRFADDAAWDHLAATPILRAVAREAEAISFGTLGQRSPESQAAIAACLDAARESCWRIFDVNLRPPHGTPEIVVDGLKRANVLKLNDEELPVVAGLLGLKGTETQILKSLVVTNQFRLIALTRGSHGSRLMTAAGDDHDLPGEAVAVVDTVGAGDAFAAGLTIGLLRGDPLDRLHRRAAAAAAYVCTRPGGTPEFSGFHF